MASVRLAVIVVDRRTEETMLVDCDTCAVRGAACGDCVISVILGAPPEGVRLEPAERRALAVLADAGMLPRLRLIPAGAADPGPPRHRGDQPDSPAIAKRRGAAA